MRIICYDPHPGGIKGCPIPLPEWIKPVIDHLCDMQPRLLWDVVGQLVAVAGEGFDVAVTMPSQPSFLMPGGRHHEGMICLRTGTFETGRSSWRLMFFLEVADE